MKFGRIAGLSLAVALVVCGVPGDDSSSVSGANCTFQAAPDRFLSAQARLRTEIFRRAQQFQKSKSAGASKQAATADPLPRRNFIDDEIFDKLANAGVQPARLATDEEFFRRINLDLTGRLPVPDDIQAFVADKDPGKRDALIERLLYSQPFVDKWTLWLGDLTQNNVS